MKKANNEFRYYMQRVVSVAMQHCLEKDGLYYGTQGALRFARECGPALLDFENPASLVGITYGGICVRAYNLKPPIGAMDWNKNIIMGMERAKR